MQLTSLSDAELIASLRALCAERRRLDIQLIVHLGEVEERSLHLQAACSSMFDFCVRKLGLSGPSAHRRINAARLAKRFPTVLEHLERGEVHLSGLVVLAKHLTEATVDELMAAVAGKSQPEIEEFLARRAPKPDVPDQVCRIPSVATQTSLARESAADVMPPVRPMRIEPLSEDRYKVQLTASSQLRDKLERAKDLMRHRNPSGDLAVVVERALDALLERLERERLGKATRPQQNVRRGKQGSIARATRREVFERDGEQCTFTDADGDRCPSRTLLELDHIEPRAMGGSDEASKFTGPLQTPQSASCRADIGKEHVARRIDFRRRKLASTATTTVPPGFDLALRGLVHMGFAKQDARRALDDVFRRHETTGHPLAVPDLVREAIIALT